MARIETPFGREGTGRTASVGFLLTQVERFLDRLAAIRVGQHREIALLASCGFIVVCSLVLGGGTRGGFLSDVILELLAVPVLLTSLWWLAEKPPETSEEKRGIYPVLAFCAVLAALPLIQLVPLPPAIWTRLPGHSEIVGVFSLIGGSKPWMPLSVAPNDTWMSFLSLLAPMAIFLTVIQLGYRARRVLTLVLVGFGFVSVFVGLMQVYQGPTSSLRFFAFTNRTEAVGFFANRNDFAALLYSVLLFTGAWAIDLAFKNGSWKDPRSLAPFSVVMLTAALTAIVVLLAGEAMARSRAGLALTIVALAGMFALALADRRNAVPGSGTVATRSARIGTYGLAARITPNKLLVGAILVAVILAVQFALYRIMARFTADPLHDARIVFAHNTIRAALDFMPFGSGFGTFVPVYQMFEPARDTLANIYVNHAHNDILEMWLESGIYGPILAGLFVVWLGQRAKAFWRKAPVAASALDVLLMRAASIVIVLLFAHSIVDYPLRTGAMMAVLAISCALLVEPWGAAVEPVLAGVQPGHRRGDGHAERQRPAGPPRSMELWTPPQAAAGAPPQQPSSPLLPPKLTHLSNRWGENIDWPDEWRTPKEACESDDMKRDKDGRSNSG